MSALRSLLLTCCLIALAAISRAQAPSGTLPTVIATPPTEGVFPGSTTAAISLTPYFGLPSVVGPLVEMQTILGNIVVELYPQTAPVTVANFLKYVNGGLFTNMIINRSIPGFVIQGGEYTVAYSNTLNAITVFGTIVNETSLSNVRGTLAMARNTDPNSATSQWFINLANNGGAPNDLDTAEGGGYAVFARVIGTGMTVADAIAGLETYPLNSTDLANTPLYDLSDSATSVAYGNWVRFPSVASIPMYPTGNGSAAAMSFSVTSSNSSVVSGFVAGSSLYLSGGLAGSATITVTATDNNGNQASTSFTAVISVFSRQPASQSVAPGGTAVFLAALNDAPAGTTYQWLFNGAPIAGATSTRLVIANSGAANVGAYTCAASYNGIIVSSTPATLALSTATNVGHLINLSVLTSDVASSQSLTLGFVIGGSTPNESLLLRASGPALQAFNLSPGVLLPDPLLTLYNGSSAVLASNAGWSSTSANQSAVAAADAATGAFALTPGSLDSALVQTLSVGTGSADYSIVISGKSGDGGTTLGEVYDDTATAFTSGATHLKNLSSSVALKPGDTLTAGFTVGGSTSKTVLVRGIGPGLAQFGVPGVMADPQLTLYASGTILASDAGWGGDPQIVATENTVGAFGLTAGSADSVILITLAPGSYSAQVNSASGGGGTALVEVYEVP